MTELLLTVYASNPGAWVSTGIVFLSVLTSWALNFTSPNVRVFGTVLAAIGCLIVAAWFFLFILDSGILEIQNQTKLPWIQQNPPYYGFNR